MDKVVVSLLVVMLVMLAYNLALRLRDPSRNHYMVGKTVARPSREVIGPGSLTWLVDSPTVVVVLSPFCPYCRQSMSFYRALAQHTVLERTPVNDVEVAVVVDRSIRVGEMDRLLQENDVRPDTLLQMDLDDIGLRSVPTILLVGADAVIEQGWTGFLDPIREEEVFRAVSAFVDR